MKRLWVSAVAGQKRPDRSGGGEALPSGAYFALSATRMLRVGFLGSLRVTRLEALLAAGAALALVLAVSWFVQDRDAEQAEQNARVAAEKLLSAASNWKRTSGVAGCPTVSQLRVDRQLSAGAPTDDPWGSRFRIRCSAAEVQVRSAGLDGEFQTADDIALSTDWQS